MGVKIGVSPTRSDKEPRRIFGRKGGKVSGGRRNLNNEECQQLTQN
jgi:general stress protein YciG